MLAFLFTFVCMFPFVFFGANVVGVGSWYGIFGHGLFGVIYRVSFDGVAVVAHLLICTLLYCFAAIQLI